MTIYYVSNAAVNGTYVVGNDANDGLTPATAKLTINGGGGTGAIAAASAGDTIYVNPGGVTYIENTPVGLNYLQINKADLTIETDPAYVATAGKATITSSSLGTRTINLNQTGITLRNFKVDNASQVRNCIFCQSFLTHNIVGIDFLNLGANAVAITAQNNNAYNITIDDCTLLAANGNAAGTKLHQITGTLGGMATVIKGSSTDTTGGLFAAGSGFGGTLTVGRSANGKRCSVANATIGIQNLSTNVTTAFDIQHVDFNACVTGIGDGGTGTATLANFVVNKCSFSGLNSSATAKDIAFISTIADGEIAYNEFRGSHQNISFSSAAIAGIEVHDNVINVTGMATGISHFSQSRGGAGLKYYNNRITSDTDSRLIALGGEGYVSAVTNSGGALAGDQNLGDVSGNTYIAQTYTYPANTTALFARYLGAYDIYLKKVGSPTGTVSCYMYTNNAGAPGTLVATSAYTLDSSLLTTSYQQVRFWFTSRTQQSYSTQYWIVVKYNGTVNASNYLQWQVYSAGTAGQKSTNGSSWSATSGALGYSVRQINLEMTQPQVYDNELRCTNATEITHCLIVNGSDGALIYDNQVYGGGIGILCKVVDGVTQPARVYNNLISLTNTGDGAALHDKGSVGVEWSNNTAIVSAASDNRTLFLEGDWLPGYLNGVPTRSPIVRNNIIDSDSTTATSIVALGNEHASDYTIISPTIDYNIYHDVTSTLFAEVNLGTAATYTGYATLDLFRAATGTDANSIQNDPILPVATVAADFVPPGNSPTLGNGVALTVPTTDYYGATRPSPPSIGGFEQYISPVTASRSLAASRTLTSTRSLRA